MPAQFCSESLALIFILWYRNRGIHPTFGVGAIWFTNLLHSKAFGGKKLTLTMRSYCLARSRVADYSVKVTRAESVQGWAVLIITFKNSIFPELPKQEKNCAFKVKVHFFAYSSEKKKYLALTE